MFIKPEVVVRVVQGWLPNVIKFCERAISTEDRLYFQVGVR